MCFAQLAEQFSVSHAKADLTLDLWQFFQGWYAYEPQAMPLSGMPGPGAPMPVMSISSKSSFAPPVKVRSRFPETWIWHDEMSSK